MENTTPIPNQPEDLLNGVINLNQASRGKRFANYLIDLIIFYVLAVLIFALLIGSGITGDAFTDEGVAGSLLDRLMTAVILGTLWGITEAVFKGKTLGMLITGTRAVNEDGTPISTKTAFIRGFGRVVPFEPFSALGEPCYPWHDKWTKTYVIDEKSSIIVS